MNTHSHNILEFNKLKDVLNEYMVIEKNKERVYELGIYKDINSLRKDFEIVRDFIDFSKYDSGIETAGMRNILEILKKCDLMGMYFEPEELYDINQNLRLMRLFKNRIEDLDKYKELKGKFAPIPVVKFIEDVINKTIDNEKKIQDDASLDLRDLRAQKKLL